MVHMKKIGLTVILAFLMSTGAMAGAGADGIWMLESGKVTVRIAPCGDNLCGAIVALAKPLNKKGQPKVDKDNPNPALRNRPLIGLTILSNMKPSGANKWEGKIYNADDGRTYSSYMKLSGDSMKVKGCVGPFCKTMMFKRVSQLSLD